MYFLFCVLCSDGPFCVQDLLKHTGPETEGNASKDLTERVEMGGGSLKAESYVGTFKQDIGRIDKDTFFIDRRKGKPETQRAPACRWRPVIMQ